MESTPFLLKNMYSRSLLEQVATEIAHVYAAFDTSAFLASVFDASWEHLELKQRMRHIAHSWRKHLPPAYPDALAVLVRTTQNMVARDGERMAFEWGIFPDFVEAYGVEVPDSSIPALEQMTQLASAEFAVRPFLVRYPERMYAQMQAWAQHPSAMVRRLSSEGFRPRLPWGMGVPVLKKDPTPILCVLEDLKQDPAETVRRSVANNLNDIAKDHPELVVQLATAWKGRTAETDWVVRHACRGLLKKGHPEALRLFGFEAGQNAGVILQLQGTPRVGVGERLLFSFVLKNTGNSPENIRLEYAINYLTSTGKISRKIFKISELQLLRQQEIFFEKHQRFQDFTTRKHYPGSHRIAILLNGKVGAEMDFEVVPA